MRADCRTRAAARPARGVACADATLARLRSRRGRARAVLARLRAELMAALAPPACLACRAPLAAAGAPLCVACRRALPWLGGPRCARCGLPAPCGVRCPARGAAFERAWAPLAHAGRRARSWPR